MGLLVFESYGVSRVLGVYVQVVPFNTSDMAFCAFSILREIAVYHQVDELSDSILDGVMAF